MRPQQAVVGEQRDRARDGLIHAAALFEEVAEVIRQHRQLADHMTERRTIDRRRVDALAHLRKLLRVAQQQNAFRARGNTDRVCERELPRLIDDEQIELVRLHPLAIGHVPGGCH